MVPALRGHPAGLSQVRLSDVIAVRQAKTPDLPDVLRIDPLADRGDAERIDQLTRAVEQEVCLLATDGTAAYGLVVLRRRHFFGRDFIDLLMVAEGHRRRGLGRLLMSSATEVATTPVVFTSTNESNEPLGALLASQHWAFSGKLDGLDRGDPELVYYLQLAR